VARIFAKSLNCEKGITPDPCGECSACREIDEGRFVDLIEVDAASRTKVDETRELLENVHYAPTRGRYKVYLIDEVHMFSNHSFNALLKTLEEPPPHVKFLLATTDPKKLPVTILSRCLQFSLKRIPTVEIEKQLDKILQQEGIDSDRNARRLVAEAADGSLRDALSLLDQAISYGGGSLREQEVAVMLGAIDRQHVRELLGLIVEGDAAGVLAQCDRIAESNPDFADVLAELLSLLQRLAVLQIVEDRAGEQVEDDAWLRELAPRLSPEDCQLYYQIGLIGRRDLPLAPDPRGGLEMVLLRMLAFAPSEPAPGGAPKRPERPATATKRPAAAAATTAPPAEAAANPAPPPAPPPAASAMAAAAEWETMIQKMGLSGRIRELAAQCAFLGIEDGRFRLLLAPEHENLRSASAESRLEEAIRRGFGEGLKLLLTVGELGGAVTPAGERDRRAREDQAAAVAAIEGDPNVQALRERFDATVDDVSVRRNPM
jgi:DNA polymerase-3 subunit gamma/tau